jgi:hypothetical protein
LSLLIVKPCYEIAPLAKHIQQVQYTKHNIHVTRWQQCYKVLHRVVQMSWEGVLYQQCRKVEDPQQQLFSLKSQVAKQSHNCGKYTKLPHNIEQCNSFMTDVKNCQAAPLYQTRTHVQPQSTLQLPLQLSTEGNRKKIHKPYAPTPIITTM